MSEVDSREEAVKDLHKIINLHWCDEFEYGESCKHCILEITLCEPLVEAMYPGIFHPPPEESEFIEKGEKE